MDFRPVLYVIGVFLIILSIIMLVPALFDLAEGRNVLNFVTCSAVTLFTGVTFYFSFKHPIERLDLKQAFALTGATWISICFFGCLPLYFSNLDLSFVDALFEMVSALTTTGASVLQDLDHMQSSILMWRSLVMAVGGIGIIVTAIAVLPLLKVGGMQLFKTESTDISPKALPRTGQIAKGIIIVYLLLSFICTIAFRVAGMSYFDAFNHAFGVVSTAGLSTHDASFGYFKEPAIHMIASVFMLLGALPFLLFYHFLRGEAKPLFKDPEVRFYLKILLIAIALIFFYRYFRDNRPVLIILNEVVFNTVSLATTSGYGVSDFTLWGSFPVTIIMFLAFMGGCTGSTTGAFKVFRVKILTLMSRKQLYQLREPRGVRVIEYGDRVVPNNVLIAVSQFFFFYIAIIFFGTLVLNFMGFNFSDAFGCSLSSLSNIGPGMTPETGPLSSWVMFPDGAKWVLMGMMILGRLEIFAILILFMPGFWRK